MVTQQPGDDSTVSGGHCACMHACLHICIKYECVCVCVETEMLKLTDFFVCSCCGLCSTVYGPCVEPLPSHTTTDSSG